MKAKRKVKRAVKPNRAKLEAKLDAAWSRYVRGRDKSCQKCNGSGSISAHHAFGRRHKATRWDVINGIGLCYPCHINWAHRDPSGFSFWFEQMVGRDQYLRLAEAHNIPVKHTADDLQKMLITLEGLC